MIRFPTLRQLTLDLASGPIQGFPPALGPTLLPAKKKLNGLVSGVLSNGCYLNESQSGFAQFFEWIRQRFRIFTTQPYRFAIKTSDLGAGMQLAEDIITEPGQWVDNFWYGSYIQHWLMLKWFTSLALVASLSGSVTAGVQMHAGTSMDMMDCCKAALAHDDLPATSGARLCCVVNCQEPSPTSSSTARPFTSAVVIQMAPKVPLPFAQELNSSRRNYQSLQYTAFSPPPYLSNLALLI